MAVFTYTTCIKFLTVVSYYMYEVPHSGVYYTYTIRLCMAVTSVYIFYMYKVPCRGVSYTDTIKLHMVMSRYTTCIKFLTVVSTTHTL